MDGYCFNFMESDVLGKEPTHHDFSRYLDYYDGIIRYGYVISRYRSKIYDTLNGALHAFHQVMLISGATDIPEFYYQKGDFKRIIQDSEKEYNNYVKQLYNITKDV